MPTLLRGGKKMAGGGCMDGGNHTTPLNHALHPTLLLTRCNSRRRRADAGTLERALNEQAQITTS